MFLDEIKKSLKIENMEFASPVVTVFGKVGAAIEGHKGLLYFSDEVADALKAYLKEQI